MGCTHGGGPPCNLMENPFAQELDPLEPGRRTVVCLHGMLSCAMLSRVQGQPGRRPAGCWPHCGDGHWQVAYVNVPGYTLFCEPVYLVRSLRLEKGHSKLSDGREVVTTMNAPGVETMVVQGMKGTRTLNPGNLSSVPVWNHVFARFSSECNLVCVNYDWRRWGDLAFAEELLPAFARSVEAAAVVAGSPVSIVTHSMGASVALYCLSKLGEAWTMRFVRQLIMVGPSLHGCAAMFEYWAFGGGKLLRDLVPTGILDVENLMTTWPCTIAEFPQAIGAVQPWSREEAPFVLTPARHYGFDDIGQFFEDVAREKGEAYDLGPALWPEAQELTRAMKAPPVGFHAIYGSGLSTPCQLAWHNSRFFGLPQTTRSAPGDNTILASTVEALARGWGNLRLHEVRHGVTHRNLIKCKATLDTIEELLAGSGGATAVRR